MTQKETLLSQAAESKIFLLQKLKISDSAKKSFRFLTQENFVAKRRIKKSYRIAEIDEKLRKLRTRGEARLMQKLEGKINVPKIIKVDEKSKEIIMQYIGGKKLSDFLDSFPLSKQLTICQEIGREVAKIHDENIIHGDLTTSNIILVENSSVSKNKKTPNKLNKTMSQDSGDLTNSKSKFKLFFIDFGLSFYSSRIEDKAVDLHLLKQALESRHFQNWQKLFQAVLESYNPKEKEKILKQFEKVEVRGRYKG